MHTYYINTIYNVPCMHVFWADRLVLDNQPACSLFSGADCFFHSQYSSVALVLLQSRAEASFAPSPSVLTWLSLVLSLFRSPLGSHVGETLCVQLLILSSIIAKIYETPLHLRLRFHYRRGDRTIFKWQKATLCSVRLCL